MFGDTSGGSPGWQMQTYCEETFEFKTFVDPIATYEFKELPSSPTLRIVPGEPLRAVCIAPSQVMVNEEFTYHLKLEDRWCNPTASPQRFTHPSWGAAGVQTIAAKDEMTSLRTESNPIEVLIEEELLHPYWADFHGQTEETVGSNSIEEYFAFARGSGLLDIVGHQGNDFQVTDEFWAKVNEVTRTNYESSGNRTPLAE